MRPELMMHDTFGAPPRSLEALPLAVSALRICQSIVEQEADGQEVFVASVFDAETVIRDAM